MSAYHLDYLKKLEAEAIHVIREAAAEAENPVMLYSVGKDSSVILELARRAFAPGPIPFPVMHVNTLFKFTEMIEFRDRMVKKYGVELVEMINEDPEALALTADDAHTDRYIQLKKTVPLLQGIKENKFDVAFGGARRDEEKARAKERFFSFRNEHGVWDPKNQRPEIWHLYNAKKHEGQSMRVFPISNWTELDVWTYIKEENIEIVPLYYAAKRKVVKRNGIHLRLDEFVKQKEGEEVMEMSVRYRTLGCSPSTGCIPSEADTIEKVVEEIALAQNSERETRAIDHGSAAAMEEKKKVGYF